MRRSAERGGRTGALSARALERAVRDVEAYVARALRQHALAEMNHPAEWTKASGYWLKGRADTAENFDR